MVQRRWLIGLCLFCSLARPAQAQVEFAWKLKVEDTFYFESRNTTTQSFKVMGNEVSSKTETTTVDSFKVVKMNADSVVLLRKIESVKIKATGAGAEGAAKLAEKQEGAIFTITLDGAMRNVTKVEGVAEFVKRVFGDNKDVQKVMEATLNEDVVKVEMQNLLAAFLPDKAVKKDDTWQRRADFSLGPMGNLASEGQFTFLGKDPLDGKELEKIDVKWNMSYAPPTKKSGLQFEVSKGNLKTVAARGSYHFDAELGRLVQLVCEYSLIGTLTLSTMGMEVSMDITKMDQTTTVKLLDKKP